jgi:hypothetical protein
MGLVPRTWQNDCWQNHRTWQIRDLKIQSGDSHDYYAFLGWIIRQGWEVRKGKVWGHLVPEIGGIDLQNVHQWCI